MPIWVKPNMIQSSQSGRGPRRLKNKKAQASNRWPVDHTNEIASKLKTNSMLARIPWDCKPCQIAIRM